MIAFRITSFLILTLSIASIFAQWYFTIGFDPVDGRWWKWLIKVIVKTGGIPEQLMYPIVYSAIGLLIGLIATKLVIMRPSTRNIHGEADARDTHGSARWAKWADIKKTGLLQETGVVVGGFAKKYKTIILRHLGPEHILAFAPTRSGKGVALVIPTLLCWMWSVIVLDIKGENFALTSGWRKLIGQRILRFAPAEAHGSVRYNPLAEVRVGTDYQIADCQNIASMIIDPDGKGLKDFWMQSGWEWLSAVILHVLYRKQHDESRTATLADVHAFMSVGDDDGEDMQSGDEGFEVILDDMARYDHRDDVANGEVRRAAGRMLKRAGSERSGVHSSATVQLALYSDPIVARNTSESDFRIEDLMNGENPTSLYLVIPPRDIARLRPLIRILMNQFMTRLMNDMEFENGQPKPNYKHRMLLMLDEFTSIGKLEIFEKALAYMAGYGLKAFIIVQDLTQLRKPEHYGRDESITSNCHIKIAYAPNNKDTAKDLSELSGKTTVVQRKRSKSHGKGGSISESQSEVARPLMTPDECSSMRMIKKDEKSGKVTPGDMLIFVAGERPIYGRQVLYFQDEIMSERAKQPPPAIPKQPANDTAEDRAAAHVDDLYRDALDKTQEAG